MKINVSNIPEGGMNLRFERNGEWFRQRLPETDPFAFVLDRIDVACAVRRMKENVFIEGSIATAGDVPCCRCLEMTHLPIQSSFKYTFAPPPSRPQEDLELSATDLDFAYYEEDTIDLDTVIFEQLLLQIPLKPLCTESCRGLCPHCGANLNKTSCVCRGEVLDERLAALKQFNVLTLRKEGLHVMANPIKRHSKSRKNMRRAHDFLKPVTASACPQCHEPKLPHHVCPNCGTYKGREIVPIKKAS